ncbi:hypothetical protein FT663_01760 [Candidozyma haemuli var. vulneris]|uniref:U3 small nucleolar RNA-associated protein 11 n=1 Tax=Candidozyma haemuli TaxID=45357 RepID=A0A2V1ASQ3_9ASCO|nr:hypothetical protein CXQ85_002330 [[Candida] haemuloni]KAF3989516.1 hypothetical protein FT662_02785 [[Candida] haemuloni var. vulneris]KAF3993771.1 hypothetical protein FT663_01760 [[Candida] haemuloni var. vulneris]PVH20536.1 hypothetical protein CXQ85_002330 [[Candida] haemuloni]
MAKLVHNVQKKQHRERSQTSDRAKYGLLEKKKDYRLRAADYHKKQAALRALRQKAAQYNPDEYYHAMTKKKTDEDGILITDRGNEALSNQQVKLYKSQDSNYVRTMRLNETQKIDKLKNKLGFKAEGKHTVFVDNEDDVGSFKAADFFNTDESMLERKENRLRMNQLESSQKIVDDLDFDDKETIDKQKLADYKLLKERMEREQQLKQVEDKLETTKELMKKGGKKKMFDDDGNVHFKWTNERKR